MIRERTSSKKKSNCRKVTFRLGELFCGPGGLACGAIRSSVKTGNKKYCISHSWASDYDQDTCETYRNNICKDSKDSVICQDVRQLNIDKLPEIDVFAYGFPCNDFSIVGKHKGINGTYGPLYSYGVKVLDKFTPSLFVAENVSGITSANGGGTFETILEDLASAGNGYRLTVHLYKFEEYGIPQARHRIIIVGIDETLGLTFQVPAPTVCQPVTCRTAIENPPLPPDVANNERTAQASTVVERLKYIKPGENAWTANLPENLQLNVKNARMSQIYKRLNPKQPSYTITGSGGGGTHGYHWKDPRALTNRERARLQTFSDDFVFKGQKESVRKQIGMAVSPLMAEIVFTAVLKTFAGIKYPCIPASWNNHPELFKRKEMLTAK